MRCLLVTILTLTAVSTSVLAQAPDSLSFQGRLADSLGAALDTTVGMTFKLYKDGSAVWTETHASVTVTGGIFNVLLGGTTPLDTMAFNAPFDLGITVGTDAEISPRTPLAAAAYAKAMPGLYTYYRDDGAFESYNVVGGGASNLVATGVTGATISGGGGTVSGSPIPNRVLASFGTIGGGLANTTSGEYATVGGGDANTAAELRATVGGGFLNRAGGETATVGGGASNHAGGLGATVSGGKSNTASTTSATVGGGESNTASGVAATVGGGRRNMANGSYATVPGGAYNSARGSFSFAAGGCREGDPRRHFRLVCWVF